MTVNESSTSSDINDSDLSYRYDWQGWKLDNVGPWWRDDPKL